MRGWAVGIMIGALALCGCGSRSTGVVEAADGLLNLTVSGPTLAAATERGLHDAIAHCAGQGRQTQILGTQMGREDYQLAFRCTGRAPAPRATPVAAPAPATPQMVLLRPEAAPVLNGEGAARRPAALPPAPPPQATLPQQPPAEPAITLLQPAKAPVLGGESFVRQADQPAQAVPVSAPPAALPRVAPVAALPAASAFPPSAELPPIAGGLPLSVPPSRLLALPPPAPSLPSLAPAGALPPLFGPVGLRRD